MDYTVYKLIHVIGLIMVFLGMGGSIALAGSAAGTAWKKASAIGHGIGLFLLLLGGFGMLARLGITDGFPGWVWAKLVIWVLIGTLPFVVRRMPGATRWAWGGAIGLGALAVIMALYKPF